MRFRKDVHLHLDWERELGIASLLLTTDDLTARCVDAREIGDELVLHYDTEGRCVEAEFLDPELCLPENPTPELALRVAFEILAAQGGADDAG